MEITSGNLRHLLCILLLIARVGDVGTTYMVTPTLALEANPIARKLGWKYALLTIAACLVPYWNPELAVMMLIPFLFVSASNAGKVWVVRTMGERAYLAFCVDLARRSRLSRALLGVASSSFFMTLAGGVILLFCWDSANGWGYWVGLGVVTYGVVIGIYGALGMVRLFRKASEPIGRSV
jgi:hypothetical protein